MADRTNGLNNTDIGSGRRGFRNRNLGLGQAGTIVDAEWANGIQEEIIRLIEMAGIAPSAANREQMLQAVRRLSGGNVRTLSATGSLTADDAGLVLVDAGSGNRVITLPAANAAGGNPLRITLARIDSSANTVTVQRAGADTIEGATSLDLPGVERLSLVSDGASAWRFQAARFTQSFGTNGWTRMPNGLIFQWGSVTTNASGQAAVTFPIAFPSNFYRAMINPLGSSATYAPGALNSSSTAGFNQNIANTSTFGIAPAGIVVGWYAVGN